MEKNRYKNIRNKSFLVILIFMNVNFFVKAQYYFFDQYSVKEGLAQSKVYEIIQDHTGYIWLGTANGVSRFDGKKFENFSSRDSLSNGGVRCIIEDSLGIFT